MQKEKVNYEIEPCIMGLLREGKESGKAISRVMEAAVYWYFQSLDAATREQADRQTRAWIAECRETEAEAQRTAAQAHQAGIQALSQKQSGKKRGG